MSNMLQSNWWTKGLILSIILHGIFLGLLLWWWVDQEHPKRVALEVGLMTAALYPRQTYAKPLKQKKIWRKSALLSKKNKVSFHPPLQKKNERLFPPFEKAGSAPVPENLLIRGGILKSGSEASQQLTNLLNRKLEENKFYPLLAQTLRQTGIAKVSFWLDKTGEISTPKIETSTNITILDEAALKTVQAINPVIEAKALLTQKKQFVVNIRFEE